MIVVRQFETQAGEGKYSLRAAVSFAGDDIVVIIAGGTREHIGAVSLATPRKSLTDDSISATASVLCLSGHKEDMWARSASLKIAALCNTNVLVSVGVHVDNAVSSDLQILEDNFKKLLFNIKRQLSNNLP